MDFLSGSSSGSSNIQTNNIHLPTPMHAIWMNDFLLILVWFIITYLNESRGSLSAMLPGNRAQTHRDQMVDGGALFNQIWLGCCLFLFIFLQRSQIDLRARARLGAVKHELQCVCLSNYVYTNSLNLSNYYNTERNVSLVSSPQYTLWSTVAD